MKIEQQIELLRKYGVTNYSIENDKITINGYLDLSSLTSADKDFLKGTTINGSLGLSSLTSADKDFLKGTTINGSLYLRSLTNADKEMLINNVKQLQKGYNKEGKYCFFDEILSKVLSVKKSQDYTLYKTPFGFIAEKGEFTAHGNTIKKSIEDLEFKLFSETLKKEPINADTMIDINRYRIITGACEQGVKQWIQQNNISEQEMKASELVKILEKTNAYGLEKFKKLITF